jgi:integrase
VQELLGHTQISITMDVYSHVLPKMQEEVMRQLDAALIKQARPEQEVE